MDTEVKRSLVAFAIQSRDHIIHLENTVSFNLS